jgi:Molybdopterin oxidoreductase
MMGLEPTTFCMASVSWDEPGERRKPHGSAISGLSPPSLTRLGLQAFRGDSGRFGPRTTLVPNGRPSAPSIGSALASRNAIARAGFQRLSWDDALDLIAERIYATSPDRLGCYMTSRGQPNENYYAVQKAVRALGSNAIDKRRPKAGSRIALSDDRRWRCREST